MTIASLNYDSTTTSQSDSTTTNADGSSVQTSTPSSSTTVEIGNDSTGYTHDYYWSTTSNWLNTASDGTSSNGSSPTSQRTEGTAAAPTSPVTALPVSLVQAAANPSAPNTSQSQAAEVGSTAAGGEVLPLSVELFLPDVTEETSNLRVGKEKITKDSAIYKKWQKDPIAKEILDTMMSKGAFNFKDSNALDLEIKMRLNIIKNMKEMNGAGSGVAYPQSKPNLRDITYAVPAGWVSARPTGQIFGPSFSWDPATSTIGTAAQAIEALYKGKTEVDCTTAVAIAYWKALLDTIGAAEFNQRFKKGIKIGFNLKTGKLFNGPWNDKRLPANDGTGKGKDFGVILPGDWVNFPNRDDYQTQNRGGFFNSENAVYMGNGIYEGLGVQPTTYLGMRRELEVAYWAFDPNHAVPDPLDAATLKKIEQQWPLQFKGLPRPFYGTP
jgi:hypothetical protein